MLKAKSLLAGIVAYLVTHLAVRMLWPIWHAQHEPWFLNDGRAVVLTAAGLCLAAFGAAARWADTQFDAVQHGANVAAGALVGMVATVVIVGPGTIFPIVIAFCVLIAFGSTLVGASVAAAFKSGGDGST